jgi:thiamine-phosphate pyrophosphorylase
MAFGHNVHFCTISPVFTTPSKVGILDPIGFCGIASARQVSGRRALIALGGIDESNAAQCIRSGADGIAVMRAIMASGNPKASAERLRAQVDAALAENPVDE